MSEYSASLHFWRTEPDEVRRLAVSQSASGRIVAFNDRWLCFVPFDNVDEPKVIAHAGELLLKWTYYADYGLDLAFFHKGDSAGKVSFVWGGEPPGQPRSASLPPKVASMLRGVGLDAASVEELERTAHDVSTGTAGDKQVRDRVARALGLAAHQWLSPETCVEVTIEQFRTRYPDAEDTD